MPLLRERGIAIALVVISVLTATVFYFVMKNHERNALIQSGVAAEAIRNEAIHREKADEARAMSRVLEDAWVAAQRDSEKWRKVAESLEPPIGPITPPVDSAAAVEELRSVGLASVKEDPFGVAINLADSGQVFRWGTAFPILTNKVIAQKGLIAGLDSQVGLLSQQKALLGTENKELRAGNEDLRVAATSYKSAYESTDKALKIERRFGTVKIIGTAALAGYAGYRLGKR